MSVRRLTWTAYLLSQNPHGLLTCGDAASLPFRDASFDLVFEANLLHHVSDANAVIGEMHRVSRKYVVLLEPNRYNPLMFAFSATMTMYSPHQICRSNRRKRGSKI